jgi:hypothetical protein
MKEPYGEGLASHTDPESCVDSRKAGHEALTGTHAGGVSSREILRNQSADAVSTSERQHREIRQREHHWDSATSETPRMHGNSSPENRETLTSARHEIVGGPVGEGDEPQFQHERWWGVGPSCTTWEAPEQGRKIVG